MDRDSLLEVYWAPVANFSSINAQQRRGWHTSRGKLLLSLPSLRDVKYTPRRLRLVSSASL